MRRNIPLDREISQHRTTYAFGARITKISEDKYTRAVMTYTVLHGPNGPMQVPEGEGVTCSRWEVSYVLERVDGRLRIYGVNRTGKAPRAWRSCDT
jgi:hypothetical protein